MARATSLLRTMRAPRNGGPRKACGGRSTRYERRHTARGHVHRNAPDWSDASAAALMQYLQQEQSKITMRALQLLDSAKHAKTVISKLRLLSLIHI